MRTTSHLQLYAPHGYISAADGENHWSGNGLAQALGHHGRRLGWGACWILSAGGMILRKFRDQLFKRSDFARLVAAARSEGLPIARIDVMRDGLSLIVGEPLKKDGTVPEAEPPPLLQGGAGGR